MEGSKSDIEDLNTQYSPISCRYFLHLKTVPCDVYVQIKKEKQEPQYVKRVHKNEPFDDAIIRRFMSQGVENFFIPTAQKELMDNYITDRIEGMISRGDLNDEIKITLTQRCFEYTSGLLNEYGFIGGNLKAIEDTVLTLTQASAKGSKLSSLIVELLKNKTSYKTTHCLIAAMIASRMLDSIEWASPNHKVMVNFIALVHDIALKEDSLASVRTADDMVSSNLPKEAIEEINTHAKIAADLVAECPNAPFGVDSLIRHHHGSNSGIGFSEKISLGKVEPLAAVFMLAESLTHEIIRAKESNRVLDIQSFWRSLYETHQQKNVVVLIDAMKAAFISR